MYKNLIYDVDGKVAKITINRPKAMNALNEEVLSEMYEALLQFEGGSEKVAMITGAGKAFVAGADIQAMVSMDNLKAHELACLGHRLMNKIESCEKPVIAAINGFALGGGLELAMACDFRLASAAAKFGQPEIALGIIPGFSGTQRLTKLVGTGMASYMIMTGEMIDAKKALDIGIIEKVIDEDQFDDECAKIAEKMASKSIYALKAGKQTIENGANMDILRGSRLEIESFAQLFSTEDQKEGMSAFLEKRKANFKDS